MYLVVVMLERRRREMERKEEVIPSPGIGSA